MSAVVQATCPGCRNILRIPSDWLAQPIRCKHCQTVLMPRQAGSQATPTPTPAPQPRPVPPAVKPAGSQQQQQQQQAGRKAPPPLPAPVTPSRPAVPPPVAADEAAVAVATPRKKKKSQPTAFDDFADEETPTRQTLRRARKPRSLVVPLVVMALFLIAAGVLVAVFWPQLSAGLSGKPIPEVAFLSGSGDAEPEGRPQNTSTTKKGGDKERPQTISTGIGGNGFPRRALIISVHNYLYANFIHSGPPRDLPSIPRLVNTLNEALRIPLTQIAHLSDIAGRGAERPPLKGVIEKTLTDFLDTSRAQDRIMIFLVGHCAEIEDKCYFVPIEGEFENVATLIPMSWILEKVGACKARQKILVVDVNRKNPTFGQERKGSGPMSEKLEALLKAPPEGVQIWSACSKDGFSYETDLLPMGVMLGTLYTTGKKALEGKINRENDPIPIEQMNESITRFMKDELEPFKLQQKPFLAGTEKAGGAEYDPAEALAKTPTLAPKPVPPGGAAVGLAIASIRDEFRVPPIKVSQDDNDIPADLLLTLAGTVSDYPAGGEDSPLRKKLQRARAVLWAVSPRADFPADLKKQVDEIRADLRVNLDVLKDGYRLPSDEPRFKVQVEEDERKVAIILGSLIEAQEELEDMSGDRDKENKRWQANYDFINSHLQAQIAYLFEYQSMLGQMRKELPPYDAKIHKGWKLASREDLSGDSTGRKMAKRASKTFASLAEDFKGTPWEVYAKREMLTNLGLEWKADAAMGP